ncbi:MAG: SGNH/GDSL hydrolase family protein [Clostridia bacterium]|nr:SGNH/GDSL hydrolase family protein [Clostridia bacterium]
MKTILFQGDSITDVGRSRSNDNERGLGYPHLVCARLGLDNPEEYNFINRGISGNRIVDLYARIKCDFINLQPDFLSILIGINDVWHEIGNQNGVSAEKFEKVYSMLIEEIKEACPDIKIMLMEPFVLPGPATVEHWEYFESETKLRAEAVKRIAEKYDLAFLPLQNLLDEACEKAPAVYWLADGVHPTAFGHELIAREWCKKFAEMQ